MLNIIKTKLIPIVLMVALVITMMPLPAFTVTAYASEYEQEQETYGNINPLYEDLLSEEEKSKYQDAFEINLDSINTKAKAVEQNESYATDVEDVVLELREEIVGRNINPTFDYQISATATDSELEAVAEDAFAEAIKHTGNPKEGDSLKFGYEGWTCDISGSSDGTYYYLTYTFDVTYYTTAEQEATLDVAIADLKVDLNINDKTDYEKVKAIYDYMCDNITYDYDNLENEDYKLKYTAYAALVNKTSVCQGYAVLLYRLALEYGIDVRVVAGTSNDEHHAWNVICLDDNYYYADSTWDAGMTEYAYFLKGSENWEDHTPLAEYATSEFTSKYQVTAEDYLPENPLLNPEKCGENVTWTLLDDGTLVISGTGAMYDYAENLDARGWAKYSADIKKLVIEEGITATGSSNADAQSYAFDDLINLEEVTLPSTLTYITKKTFPVGAPISRLNIADLGAYCNIEVGRAWWDSGCYPVSNDGTDVYLNGELITDLVVPSSVKNVREYAFYQWKAVKTASFEYGVESLDQSCFSNCYSLTKIDYPESITNIGNYVFQTCTSLKELTIPDTATTIGSSFITSNMPLETLSIPISYRATQVGQSLGGGLPRIQTYIFTPGPTGVGYDYNTSAVTSYYSYKNTAWYYMRSRELNIVLEEGITHIGNYMFKDCTGITTLTIPSTVTSIGTEAIDKTVKLTVYHGTYGETFAKDNGYSYEVIHTFKQSGRVESTCTSHGYILYKCHASKCTETKKEELPLAKHEFNIEYTFDDGTEYGYCKYGCGMNNLSFTIDKEDVGSLTNGIKWYLYDEKYLIISGSGDIANWTSTPWENRNIEYCYVEEGITSIGSNIFANTGLSVVSIPDSVIDIDLTAFAGCYNLKSIKLSDNHPTYRVVGNILTDIEGETILFYFGNETEIEILDQYKVIGENAFLNCDSNTKVILPYNFDSFESYKAFLNVTPCVYENSYARRYFDSYGINWSSLGLYKLPWEQEDIHYEIAYNMLKDYLQTKPSYTVTTQPNITNSAYKHTLSAIYSGGMVKLELVSTVSAAKYYTTLYLDESGLVNNRIFIECWLNGTVDNGYSGMLTTDAENLEYGETRLWDFEPGKYMGAVNEASSTVIANDLLDTLLFNVSTEILDDAGLYITDLGFINFYQNNEGTIHLNPIKEGGIEPSCTTGGRTDDLTCPICGAYKEGVTIGAPGHSYNKDYTVDKKASLTEDGSMSKHCIKCSDKAEVTVIPKIASETLEYVTIIYTGNANEPKVTVLDSKGKALVKGTDYTLSYSSNTNVGLGKVTITYTGKYTGTTTKTFAISLETPVNVKVNNVASSGKPKVTWNAVEGAEKYEVYRATSSTGTYSRMYTTANTSYTNTGAEVGKTYYYKVKAVYGESTSDFSEVKYITCDLPCPTNVKVSNVASSGKPKVTWTAVSGASKYYVYRATSSTGTYSYLGSTTNTHYTNTGAEAGKTYYYKVKAVHPTNEYAYSAQSAATYITCDLAAPTNVKVSNVASSGKPKVTWTAVTGASKYYVYRATSKDGTFSYLGSTTNTYYTNTGAEAGKTYYYKVKAVHPTNEYAYSAQSSYTYITCDLAQPTNVKITLSNNKPKITWNAVSGATKYEVYRKVGDSGTYSKFYTTTNTSFTNTGATKGTKYYYKVVAVCGTTSYGNSAYSSEVSIISK